MRGRLRWRATYELLAMILSAVFDFPEWAGEQRLRFYVMGWCHKPVATTQSQGVVHFGSLDFTEGSYV